MSDSLLFLHSVEARSVETLSKDNDLDITKQAPDITKDELILLLEQCPFVLGAEFVTKKWLLDIWNELSYIFAGDCEAFPCNLFHGYGKQTKSQPRSNKAADQSDFIAEMVTSAELFSPLRLTSKEAYTIVKEIPIYEECGILCRIPDWWKRKSSSIKAAVSMGEKEPSLIEFDSLVQFTPSFQFG